jgi:hypothetical protein
VETILAFALALCQDPRDRLQEAVREVKLKDAEEALKDLSAGDGARAARALVSALPKARDAAALLHGFAAKARENLNAVDDSFNFAIDSERQKRLQLEEARARVRETSARALDGERVYEAIRGTFYALKPEAALALAADGERSGSWLQKCEVYEGLAAVGGEAELLAALEREKEPVVLAQILSGLFTERARAHLDHPQWQVRLAALQSLGASRGAVGPIVERLGEPDARFRNAACAALAKLTNTELPADPALWQDWWKANGEDFRAGRYVASGRKELPGPGRTTFYDIPLASSRVCFVIDRSGSMRDDGRFDAAKKELRAILDRLPDGARVNIVFFGGTTSVFSRLPSRVLDAQSRRDAIDFVERQGFESGTDLHKALEKALTCVGVYETGKLREDGVDTLVVLSDGQATVGRVLDDEAIARVIARKSRYFRPVFHCVSLSSDAPSLKLLARLTGGEYRMK